MTPQTNPKYHATILGLPADIQSILLDAGIAVSDAAGTKLLLSENNLTLTLGSESGPRTTNFSDREPDSLTMPGFLSELMTRLEELSKNPSPVTGKATGFDDLDEMTAGMQDGDLIILAGRPGMGKTALALNIAEHVSLGLGLPVLIYSMGTGGMQIAGRFLSSVAHVDQQRLRTGRLEARDWDRLNMGIAKLNDAPIHIDSTPALTALELCARARRIWSQYMGLGLIVVDCMQLMSASASSEYRATDIPEISRSLKALAKELKVPIVAVSKLDNAVEHRPNKRPLLPDLRDYSAIEQDADLILFIYRDEVYDPESPDKGTAEIIIRKQRNGPIGTVRLTFVKQNTKFENYTGLLEDK